MQLWDAEVSLGEPAGIKEDRALSPADRENEEDGGFTRLTSGERLTRYVIEPGRTDFPGEFQRYMLACSYGVDGAAAINEGPGSAMLVMPLAYKSKAQCDVISPKRAPDGLRRPIVSAVCKFLK